MHLPGDYQKMLCGLTQNKVLSIDAELEKNQFKGLEMRKLDGSEKFTSQVLYTEFIKGMYIIGSCKTMDDPDCARTNQTVPEQTNMAPEGTRTSQKTTKQIYFVCIFWLQSGPFESHSFHHENV